LSDGAPVNASIAHLPGSNSILELPRMLSDPLGFLQQRLSWHGPIFRSRFLFPVVFLIGPEANKTIHVTGRAAFSYRKGFAGTAFGRLFEGSLLLEDGETHEHDRDILQPAMGRLALAGGLGPVWEIWSRATRRLDDRRSHDVYDLARETTFEVAANVLLGLDLKEELDWFRPLFAEMARATLQSLPHRYPLGALDRGLRAREAIIRGLGPRIEAARQGDSQQMLGLLARHVGPDGRPLETRRIAEHLLLLFWAGYDTTASTAAWTLHELAHAPAWQDRLNAELPSQDGAPPSYDGLMKVPAQGFVLREIERLHPAGIFFPRGVTQSLEILGAHVPEGTLVFYSPYLTHRLESLFPEAEAFKPERWDPALRESAAPLTALVGFGGGPRICLGKAFALMQLRVMLTCVLGRYRLVPDPSWKMETVALPIHRPRDSRLLFRR
jgi:cytochrome P450